MTWKTGAGRLEVVQLRSTDKGWNLRDVERERVPHTHLAADGNGGLIASFDEDV